MTRYRFDQIAENSTAKKKPEESDRNRYVGLEHLDPGTLEVTRWGAEVAPKGDKLLMKKGDVLFGRRRAYQKKVGIAPFDGVFSAHGMVLRPKADVVDPMFFPFFISSDIFLDEAIRVSVGSLSPTANWKDLRTLEFDLPSPGKQRELAGILSEAESLKGHYRKLLTTCDDVVKSQFVEMFEGKGYPLAPIGELAQSKMPTAKKTYHENDLIRYIDISSIDNGAHAVSGYTEVPLGEAPSRAQQCIRKGDLLISTVRPNLKNIAINSLNEDNLVASSGFCVLRCKGCPPVYMKAIVCGDRFTREMCRLTTGVNYQAIKNADILKYQVPVPPQEAMREFADFAASVDKSKFTLGSADATP